MLRLRSVSSRVPVFTGRVRIAPKSDLAAEPVEIPPANVAEPAANPLSAAFKEALEPYKSMVNQKDVKGCRDLVDVRQMMEIYRQFRDDPKRGEDDALRASDIVHSILTTLRVRMSILRPMLHAKRSTVVQAQNTELLAYLREISSDMVAGKIYLSTFALTYLMTAFATINCHAEATQVWRELNAKCETLPANLGERLLDPKVVGSFIRFVDPGQVSLEEIKATYDQTVASQGNHILLDDALAIGYLRFGEWAKSAELYAHMCRTYDMQKWQTTFSRLHNQILTDVTDPDIALAFFESATSGQARVKLHPSAATKYVERFYEASNDIAGVVEIYHACVRRMRSKFNFVSPENYQNLTRTVVALLTTHFPTDSVEGRALMDRLLDNNPPIQLINTLASRVTKAWPDSSYLEHLQKLLLEKGRHRVDSLRILLNSAQDLPDLPLATIEKWWSMRSLRPEPIDYFDLLALMHACNRPERAAFFQQQLAAAVAVGFDDAKLRSQTSRFSNIEAAITA